MVDRVIDFKLVAPVVDENGSGRELDTQVHHGDRLPVATALLADHCTTNNGVASRNPVELGLSASIPTR
ncbi:MAG: hypothetical protein ACI8XO_004770 [Verrucomicrobiales bacterium]|jgi:hypothetical protein